MNSPILLFSTPRYASLAAEIAQHDDVELGQLDTHLFPDGERYLRILSPVVGRRVAVLGGTIDDAHTLFLYDLAYSAVKQGASSLELLIPYFGYSTMERAERSGEVVTAKTRACILSSIPTAHYGNRVILLDLHTGGLPHYFERAMTPVHLSARQLILEGAKSLAAGEPFVIACTDTGRAKRVEAMANDLDTVAAVVIKKRLDGSSTQVTAMAASVAGRDVVIYDDMIRTGGSLLQAARAYRDAGANRITAIATHGLFPGDALSRLRDSQLLAKVLCTNSHPRAVELAEAQNGGGSTAEDTFLEIRSIATLLHDAMLPDSALLALEGIRARY